MSTSTWMVLPDATARAAVGRAGWNGAVEVARPGAAGRGRGAAPRESCGWVCVCVCVCDVSLSSERCVVRRLVGVRRGRGRGAEGEPRS